MPFKFEPNSNLVHFPIFNSNSIGELLPQITIVPFELIFQHAKFENLWT
jgi:hypothetical protein